MNAPTMPQRHNKHSLMVLSAGSRIVCLVADQKYLLSSTQQDWMLSPVSGCLGASTALSRLPSASRTVQFRSIRSLTRLLHFVHREQPGQGNDYRVVGTVDHAHWHQGVQTPPTNAAMPAHRHGFNEVVRFTPVGGWRYAPRPARQPRSGYRPTRHTSC